MQFKDEEYNDIDLTGLFQQGMKHGMAKQTTNKGQLQFALYENDRLTMIKNQYDQELIIKKDTIKVPEAAKNYS